MGSGDREQVAGLHLQNDKLGVTRDTVTTRAGRNWMLLWQEFRNHSTCRSSDRIIQAGIGINVVSGTTATTAPHAYACLSTYWVLLGIRQSVYYATFYLGLISSIHRLEPIRQVFRKKHIDM